jgi:hypothetical protein
MLLSPPDGAGRCGRLRLPTAAAWRRAQRAVWLLEQPRHVQRRQWPYRPIVNALRGASKNNEGADRDKMGPIADALRGHRERWEAYSALSDLLIAL